MLPDLIWLGQSGSVFPREAVLTAESDQVLLTGMQYNNL
jgi:hypothetical protein